MIEGKQIIGFDSSAGGRDKFNSLNPATGEVIAYQFSKATGEDIEAAAQKAAAAFQEYRRKSGAEKATFLEAIAREIEALGESLIDICCQETALPKGRIEGERGRTTNQLKLFANLLREGSWVNARIDKAIPDRQPLPKQDIRYMEIGLGPVAVFGASNFPLAFSVAGGDTASALAAGCPVIVKAHPAHPATSELVARAITKAAKACNMPDGVFSMLHGDGPVVGLGLVKHPEIKAVGFTGSYTAGRALFDAAACRPAPIPVYAEMGSTNPVFVLPEAMQRLGEGLAQGFAASVTMGVGQFCTNPGLMMYQRDAAAQEFTSRLAEVFGKSPGGAMLTQGIHQAYTRGVSQHQSSPGLEPLAVGLEATGANAARPALFKTNADHFTRNPDLAEEIFGPTSLLVEADSREELLSLARNLSGHLTATIHGTEADLLAYKDLISILEQKVGRIVINGFPTGVEVCHSMVHGGPFPATIDGRSTSVGTAAIHRFTRPVCYQNLPDALLPAELKNQNPLDIWRMVDGEQTKGAIA